MLLCSKAVCIHAEKSVNIAWDYEGILELCKYRSGTYFGLNWISGNNLGFLAILSQSKSFNQIMVQNQNMSNMLIFAAAL